MVQDYNILVVQIKMKKINFKVYQDKVRGMFKCRFYYELKGGHLSPFVCYGKTYREALELALDQYKQLVLSRI